LTELTFSVCPPIELLEVLEPEPPALPLVPLAVLPLPVVPLAVLLPPVLDPLPLIDPLPLAIVPVTSTLWPTCFFSSVSCPSSV